MGKKCWDIDKKKIATTTTTEKFMSIAKADLKEMNKF